MRSIWMRIGRQSAAQVADSPRLAETWGKLRHSLPLKAASGELMAARACHSRSHPILVSRQPRFGSGSNEHLRDPQCDLFAAALAVRDVVERHVPAGRVSV